MNVRAREWPLWGAATVAVALLVHLGSLYVIPRLVVARAMAKIGEANEMHFMKRADANSRLIVRPSPDLLYAACPFDLSRGPLRLKARVPHSTYWSVSAFDSNTNNFFTRNDEQIDSDVLEMLVVRPHMAWPALDSATERVVLFSPSDKGVILIRTLIDSDSHLPALESLEHQASCSAVASSPGLR